VVGFGWGLIFCRRPALWAVLLPEWFFNGD